MPTAPLPERLSRVIERAVEMRAKARFRLIPDWPRLTGAINRAHNAQGILGPNGDIERSHALNGLLELLPKEATEPGDPS